MIVNIPSIVIGALEGIEDRAVAVAAREPVVDSGRPILNRRNTALKPVLRCERHDLRRVRQHGHYLVQE